MFDKDRFSDILKDIILCFNSLRDFSNECNVNRTTISKLVRKELDNPPSPEILKKIADNSKGLTTYMELMIICGYVSYDDIEEKEKNLNTYNDIRTNKISTKNRLNSIKLSKKEEEIANKYINEITKDIKALPDDLKANRKKINRKIAFDKLAEIKNIQGINNKNVFIYCVGKIALDVGNLVLLLQDMELIKNSDSIFNIDTLLYSEDNITDKSELVYKKIPVLGSIPAGIPIELIEDILDYEDISEEMLKGGKEYFALKVKGSSMWPKYLDGDTIIVLKQDDCESGQDAIVMVNGNDGTFKRVIKKDNGITLEPINQQEYNSVSYSNEDIEKLPIKILGVVKEIRRKI